MFLGQEEKPKPPEPVASDPQKSFYVLGRDGEGEVINCDYVNFHAAHISFWRRVTDNAKQDTLVEAIPNGFIEELREVDISE